MKNKNIFIISIIALILIIGGLVAYNYLNKSNLKEINIKEVIEKVNNKENFVLCISKTTCTHCNSYKPKLDKISKKYNLEIFYIDIDKYSTEEESEFKKYISFDGSTPVTVFIKNGEEKTASNRIFGNLSYDKVLKKIKKEGFINE